MKKPLHKHLLVRGLVNNPVYDESSTQAWLTEFVSNIGMKIIQGPFTSYVEAEGNRGLTATVMIETSHIAFHLWDEKDPGLLQFDLYTCSELNVSSVLQQLESFFQFKTYEYLVFDREETFVLIDGSFVINAFKE